MNREVHNEQEVLDKDEQAVSGLVAGLKHIEAPANFERRVMAKIAEGQPQRSRGLFAIPAIVYAVPALLVLLIATFVVFKLRETMPAEPTIVATNVSSTPSKSETPIPESTLPLTPTSSDSAVAKVDTSPSAKSLDRRRGGSIDFSEPTNSNKGGSYVKGQRQTQMPMPEGLQNPSPSSANRNDVMMSSSIPVSQVFDMLGISVETSDAWRVAKVRENGTADKSGVKVGDVITAFDDQDVNTRSGSINFGSISKITVRRDGKLVPLKLVPR
jgi:hypothetical protein